MKKMLIDDAIMHLLYEAIKDSAAYSRYAKALRVVSSLPIEETTRSRVMEFLGYWTDGEPRAWLQRELGHRAARARAAMEGK